MVQVVDQVVLIHQPLQSTPTLEVLLLTLAKLETLTKVPMVEMVVKRVEIPKLLNGGILTSNQVKVDQVLPTVVMLVMVTSTAVAEVEAPDLGTVELENQENLVPQVELW